MPSGGVASAAPKCKKGLNKRKCRCPKGSRLTKRGKRWACVKPKAQTAPPAASTTPTAPPATTTAPAGGGTTPAAPQQVRDDAALLTALTGQALQRPSNTDRGYSFTTYNFLPDRLGDVTAEGRTITLYRLRYCTYSNYGGVGSRENFDGVWAVYEGFTSPSAPGAAFGKILAYRQGMGEQTWQIGVQIRSPAAALNVGSPSPYFEGGEFKVFDGQATTDCERWIDGG